MADNDLVYPDIERRISSEDDRRSIETRVEKSVNKTLGVYDKMYKQNFDIIKENQAAQSTKLDSHIKDERKWQDAQTERVTQLRETVNNGLTHKVASIQKSMFWFIGIWVTLTGGIFGTLFWIIDMIRKLHVGG